MCSSDLGLDLECESALDVGLVEARENPMGVVALEGGVQVGALVERILEATQPRPVVHGLRCGSHAKDVVLFEVGEDDSPAVEGAGRQRIAIQLDALDRRTDELDERFGARPQAAKLDRGERTERLVAACEVQLDFVARLGQERGARPRLLTGEIVPGRYIPTLVQEHDSALPGRK